MHLVFLGAPGAGKGTQASRISQKMALVHISSGDLFREEADKGSDLGLLAKSYMERGMLVPNEITIQMILERIDLLYPNQGFILDGFPRTLEQAKAIDSALEKKAKAIDRVVYIEVPSEELLKRLSGRWICHSCQAPYSAISGISSIPDRCIRCGGELYQRPDDTIGTAKKRIEVYLDQTSPLIDYYRTGGKLIEVNGENTIERITEEILTSLHALDPVLE